MVSFGVEGFQEARLIPVTGIKGAYDQERRASSALLAVASIRISWAWRPKIDA
jgi:hypothetical protein